jgi:hypothetical protein
MGADPLAGQRQAVNTGTDELRWPDRGNGCPVKPGQSFSLRTCTIVIRRTWRVPARAGWSWRATFVRHFRDRRLWLLGRSTGYTDRAAFAIRAWDADGPEPEAVAPGERLVLRRKTFPCD